MFFLSLLTPFRHRGTKCDADECDEMSTFGMKEKVLPFHFVASSGILVRERKEKFMLVHALVLSSSS